MTPTADGGERILIVDDDPFIRESLRELLEHEGYLAFEAGDGKTALHLLDEEALDLLLLDLELPRVSGMAVLEEVAERRLDLPVVIVSGKGTIPMAVRATKLGAFDFIEKPLDAPRTLRTVRSALDRSADRRRARRTRELVLEKFGMVGTSPALQVVYDRIERAASTRAKVLAHGESGTGKEMVARAIHRLSDRADRRFVAVNCAAIPEPLIESELFGHVEGAFTGADRSRVGRFQEAHGGTLFLDEVGDMSLMTQAKVLRAIERGEIQRLGDTGTTPVDLRVIAATNKHLREEIEDGNFREDLFYRLSVITIRLPPLRRRPEDILDLAEHFLHVHARANEARSVTLSPGAREVLVEYDWPGNVRELSNAIERLVVLSETQTVDAAAVRRSLRLLQDSEPGEGDTTDLREARRKWEREYITRILIAHDWRIQETADALGINRSHLWKKMGQLGIEGRK